MSRSATHTPIVYLHGFASSPHSTKATYLGERFRAHGCTFVCPDLNEPDFATLTMTRMLERVAGLLDDLAEPSLLIGSSLGGTLAVLLAERFPSRVDRLVLMAPAVMFAKPGHHLLPPERLEAWRRSGELAFFHYAANREEALRYAFYEDSLQYDAFNASFAQPALVFQGLRDASVDARTVEQFALGRSNVTLSLLDDDHQLTASLPRMWIDIEAFVGLVA
ncbi:MAG: alpha/beta hydrolase [Vicinamibacterales bacterium]